MRKILQIIFPLLCLGLITLVTSHPKGEAAPGKQVVLSTPGVSFRFSPSENILATGGWKETKLWDTNDWRYIRSMKGHTLTVTVMAFSPDGAWLATASNPHLDNDNWVTKSDYHVKLWNVATGKFIRAIPIPDVVTCIRFIMSGKKLCIASITKDNGEEVRVVDVESGKANVIARGKLYQVSSIDESPSGLLALGGWERSIDIYNLKTSKLVRSLRHSEAVQALAFTDKEKQIVSISQDGFIRKWDVGTGKVLFQWRGPGYVTNSGVSADGAFVVGGAWQAGDMGDGSPRAQVWVYSFKARRLIFESSFKGTFQTLAISPTGKWLVIGGVKSREQGTVLVQEVGTFSETLKPSKAIGIGDPKP